MRRNGRSDHYDAVIVGGGVGALTAAAYLARGGGRVLLLESGERFCGNAKTVEFAPGYRAPLFSHMVCGLDGRVLRELGLAKAGLEFAQQDVKLIALRPGGKHIVLSQHRGVSASETGDESHAYRAFQKEAARMAGLLAPLWDGTLESSAAAAALVQRLHLNPRDAERVNALVRLSAAAYLDLRFGNDALKAALAFDVFPSGMSPQEAGSALALIWRQGHGGVSQIRGGPAALAIALETAARDAGAELRGSSPVASIVVEKRRAIGVTLENGEMISAKAVLTSLNARSALLGLVLPEALGFGTAANVPAPPRLATAQLMLALNGPPPFAGLKQGDLGARFLIAERPEIAAEAKGAALTGVIPDEFVIEAAVPTAADPALAPPGCHVLSALLPYMPASPCGGWETECEGLRKRAMAMLEWFAPGLKDRVVAHRLSIRGAANSSPPLSRLIAPYDFRLRTPIAGLFLCGRGTEPLDALCGRAGRLAAALAVTHSASGAP